MNVEDELIFQGVFNQFFREYPEPLTNLEKERIRKAIPDLHFKLQELGNIHKRKITKTRKDQSNRIWQYQEEEDYLVRITDEEFATLLLYAFLISNKEILDLIFHHSIVNETYIAKWLKIAQCKYRHSLFNYREFFST